jgi:Flp pilus assembly protein protease CpaA
MRLDIIVVLSVALLHCLVRIAVRDWRTYKIPNSQTLIVALLSAAIVVTAGHVGLVGLAGAVCLSLLALLYGALRWWQIGDTKLMMALSIMLIEYQSFSQTLSAFVLFMLSLLFGLMVLAITHRTKLLHGKVPGAVVFILPGLSLCLLAVGSLH